jgi:hypothetical protein
MYVKWASCSFIYLTQILILTWLLCWLDMQMSNEHFNLFIWHKFYFHKFIWHLNVRNDNLNVHLTIESLFDMLKYRIYKCECQMKKNCELTCASLIRHVYVVCTCGYWMNKLFSWHRFFIFCSIFFRHVFMKYQMHMWNEHPFCICDLMQIFAPVTTYTSTQLRKRRRRRRSSKWSALKKVSRDKEIYYW